MRPAAFGDVDTNWGKDVCVNMSQIETQKLITLTPKLHTAAFQRAVSRRQRSTKPLYSALEQRGERIVANSTTFPRVHRHDSAWGEGTRDTQNNADVAAKPCDSRTNLQHCGEHT